MHSAELRGQQNPKTFRNGRELPDGRRLMPEGEQTETQLRDLLSTLSAAASGDFSARVPLAGSKGLMRQIAQKFNRVVELNEALTDELMRVERVVRREGRMTETASLRGVTGGWSHIVHSVNSLISGLVQPSTEVARVISAVADGDLTQKMAMEIDGQPVKGEFLRIGKTVNAMVDQLSSFAAEVTRVAKEVGTDGKLGGQARGKGVSGTWKDSDRQRERSRGNLTAQVRNIAKVTTAVANGDLSRKSRSTPGAKSSSSRTPSTRWSISFVVRRRGYPGRERGRHRRQTRRPGGRQGVVGRLEGSDRQRQLHGVEPDHPGPRHRQGGDRRRQRRPFAEARGGCEGRDCGARRHHQQHDRAAGLFAEQVTERCARTVGVEGKLGATGGGPGVAGTWKDLPTT